MKKTFFFVIVLVFVAAAAYPVSALRVDKTPHASTLHLGLVFGPGTGINLGADFLFPINALRAGVEGEILVTNHDLDVNFNGRRLGGVLRYEFVEDLFSAALHVGKTWFIASKDVVYKDVFSGESHTIYADENMSAAYLAASLDFIIFGEYILSPKLALNSVDGGGSMLEANLNLGHEF